MSRRPMPDSERRLTDERRDLAATCYPMAYLLGREFARLHRLDPDECVSFAMYRLCDAARTYNPAKGSFSNHAWSCLTLRFRTPNLAGDLSFHIGPSRDPGRVKVQRLGELQRKAPEPEPTRDRPNVEPLLSRLTEQERTVVELRYMLGYTQKACGARYGVTPARIGQIEKQAIAKMRA